MSTKLFKNTEGKVLMSVGNKLIKQPYEFGLGFQNRMGLNNYFEATNLNIQKGWSYLIVCKINTVVVGTDNGLLSAISTTLNLSDNIMTRRTQIFPNIIDNIVYTTINTIAYNPIYFNTTDNSSFFNGNNLTSTTNIVTNGTRDILRIGVIGAFNGNVIGKASYMGSDSTINKVYVFNRSLSIGEILYFKNNLLYNELQSRDGLMYEYDLSKVDIISIDGVDNVCARELVSGRHAIMYNLPAGTLQQKVDYANANLFVPFQ